MEAWNCTEFENQLQETLDARRPLSSLGWETGTIPCAHCRERWEEFALLEAAIPAWKQEHFSSDITVAGATVDYSAAGPWRPNPISTSHSPVSRRRTARSFSFAIAATAVAVLLAVSPFPRDAEMPQAEPPSQAATQLAVRERSAAPGDNVGSVRQPEPSGRSEGSLPTVLADDGDATFGSLAALLPSSNSLTRLASDAGTAPSPDSAAWIDQWGRDLQPIGDDVHRATRFLFNVVSIEDEPSI